MQFRTMARVTMLVCVKVRRMSDDTPSVIRAEPPSPDDAAQEQAVRSTLPAISGFLAAGMVGAAIVGFLADQMVAATR